MLLRWDPFREMDRLADQARVSFRTHAPYMPMDAYRRQDELVVSFDLPGVDPASVDVTVEKNMLSVRAERSWTRNEGDEVIVDERPQGTFSRELFLGEGLNSDAVSARYENGVLTVRIPVAETARPRKVTIATGGDKASIGARSSDAS